MPHVAVLKGGLSSEREVSLNSGAAVEKALGSRGYHVTPVDVGHDIAEVLHRLRPDLAFNALHGTYGEDGAIQGVLEYLQIPYTHSGVLASAVAMHKPMAKKLFAAVGIPVAPGKVVSREQITASDGSVLDMLPRPYVVKPIDEGSSVGVLIVQKEDKVSVRDAAFPKAKTLLVESFIEGRELTVGVLENQPLGVIEVRPKQGWYDYRNKYTAGMTEYLVPAPIEKHQYEAAQEFALLAHIALGCRGVSRSDFRMNGKGEMFILETNTHPGMTATSLVPKMAAHAGIPFEELVEMLVQAARLDHSG